VSQGSLTSYTVGFIYSLVLTFTAYIFISNHVFSGNALIGAIIALAIVQLLVQLVFFLHLDRESKPRWNLVVLLFALMVVLIVVIGSLWIMSNLNYHMDAHQSDTYIIHDEGIKK
ncbi:MAG: putative cytochrome ubiquinol oxidase chain cyoD, partial [Candidatus Saccharibacteria bacterium]|nr:putative cytochrome ubiquinol oxidase chain cyoD [Candidatus Saccharibacteria bacterium]